MAGFHMTIDLRGGLRLSDRKLRGIIKDGDRHLTPAECRELFVQKLREGFDVLPVCDHHDERGYCLGHEREAGSESRGPVRPNAGEGQG